MAQVTIGTVSAGTLRTEDLLEAFADELKSIKGDNDLTQEVYALAPKTHDMEYSERDGWEYCLRCDQAENDLDTFCAEWQDPGVGSSLVQELQGALNESCPPFVYFGAHLGDGADFGFWPDMDSLREATDMAGHTDYDNAEWVLPSEGVIIQVSDHGNILVMDMDRNELWSVV